jgi:hypothetical protein
VRRTLSDEEVERLRHNGRTYEDQARLHADSAEPA